MAAWPRVVVVVGDSDEACDGSNKDENGEDGSDGKGGGGDDGDNYKQ